ncbi:MAG: tail fiber domain-containing protein [Caulobacteraceae bacterium]|nr:tail fiber domain-containing protein [Caulobacteraceae bacterium]
MAYMLLDTTTNIMWHYKKQTKNAWLRLNLLPSDTASMLTPYIERGDTASMLTPYFRKLDTINIKYVNTYGTQTVNGAKTFNSTVTATRFDPTSSSATGTGMFLPAANTLGFSTNGTEKMTLNSKGDLGLYRVPGNWVSSFKVFQIGTSAYWQNNNSSIVLSTNYVATSSGDKYIENGAGSAYQQDAGKHIFYTYPFGLKDSITPNATVMMTLKSDSELQIAGTTDRGAYNLQVNGTGVWGEGAYVNGSDGNIKENIRNLDSSLNIVNNLKPVVFNYINQSVNNDTKHLGFLAQDVYQTLENKDYLGSIVRSDGETLSIAYSNIIPLLTKAIQEQQTLIKALEQRIINLENK